MAAERLGGSIPEIPAGGATAAAAAAAVVVLVVGVFEVACSLVLVLEGES